jgi:hypothetical protein
VTENGTVNFQDFYRSLTMGAGDEDGHTTGYASLSDSSPRRFDSLAQAYTMSP